MKRKDDLQNGYFLWQDPELFGFGIDAVLLAHFPEIRNNDRILDLCTGCGPVPVLMAAAAEKEGRSGVAFTGMEIQEEAASLADESVRDNGLSDRIRILRGDLREAEGAFGANAFSLITCNPPYQKVGSGALPKSRAEALARVELGCTLEDVIRVSARLLKQKGRLALIHRPGRLPELMCLLADSHLEPKRLRTVHSKSGGEAVMVLVEAVKGGRPDLQVLPPLVIYGEDGRYTEEVLRIYGRDGGA